MRTACNTKDRIDRAALRLFVEKGIAETTIRDIAAAAGIAEGTIYRHYASKDELAWELFSRNYAAFALSLDGVQMRHRTAQRKLQAMVQYFCQSFDNDWELFTFLLLSQHSQVKRLTAETPSPVAVLRRVLAAAMDAREIPSGDLQLATAMVLGIVLQVAVEKVYRRIDEPLAPLAETLASACWRVVKGQPRGETNVSDRSHRPRGRPAHGQR